MKKIILGIIGGLALGALLIGLVIFIGSFQSVGSQGNHKDPTQNSSANSSETESLPSEEEPSSDSEEPSESET